MCRQSRAQSAAIARLGSTVAWIVRQRGVRSTTAATSHIAFSSPMNRPPSRRVTGRAHGACRSATATGDLATTQNDDIVDQRSGFAVRPRRLPFDRLDPHSFPFRVRKIQCRHDFVGAGKLVVVVQFRRPRRRPAVIDDQQQPAGADAVCRSLEDPGAVQWQGGVQELSRHQIEGCPRGSARTGRAAGTRSGRPPRARRHPRPHVATRFREMSTATTCQPRSASHMASPPSPQPRSSAVPGFSGSTISANAAFTRPLHTRSRSP